MIAVDLGGGVAELRSARGTVWLTIFSMPPPTSFLYLMSAMSGSMPVVSQSIMKPMVPVGASTVTWELRPVLHRAATPRPTPASGRRCSRLSLTAGSCGGLAVLAE